MLSEYIIFYLNIIIIQRITYICIFFVRLQHIKTIQEEVYRKFLFNVNKTLKRKLFYFLKIVDFLDSRSITLNDAKSLKAKNDKTLRSNKISKLRNDPIN